MKTDAGLTSGIRDGFLEIVASGAWVAAEVERLEPAVDQILQTSSAQSVTIDLQGVTAFDTFGACLVERLLRTWKARGQNARVIGLDGRFQGLMAEIESLAGESAKRKRTRLEEWQASLQGFLTAIGLDVVYFVAMLGAAADATLRVVRHSRSFRLTSAVHHLDRVGFQAIPIILLITFLIGVIIAQQGFFHFRKFGADDYVVDLVGILILREIGVLIVAIMVAGRSGSAYTAELGSMKMREEIDALRTMGLDPTEVLVLPRILALIIALPILTFLGSISALFGGGLVARFYGGMSPAIYIARLQEAISVTHFEVGILKAPFMALIIGIVGCSEGLRVKGSAQSLGQQTTTSVVKSIFLVIVLDGLFAVFFASIGM